MKGKCFIFSSFRACYLSALLSRTPLDITLVAEWAILAK